MAENDDESPRETDTEDSLNPKRRGLGRGLNALFEDEESVYPQAPTQPGEGDWTGSGLRRRLIGIGQLVPGSSQPRQNFHEDSIRQLADSIATHGVLQPLLVRERDADPGTYEIIAGERRWRAAQLAHIHEIPAIIHSLDDREALEIALIENLQREDLNPLDEAAGYQRLMEQFGHSQEKLAATLGRSRSHIANSLRLLKLPEPVQAHLRDGKLSSGHARALLGADDADALARKIISQGLSVRQTEKLAREEGGETKKKAAHKSAKPSKDVDTLALEREVGNRLGMKVSIDMKDSQAGTMTLSFKTLDQLDEVLHRLSHSPKRTHPAE